jgi:hypothetical protein
MRPKINPLDKVKVLYPDFSDKEIAEKLKVKESYVRNVGGRFGLKKKNRNWKEKEKKDLLKYYEYGISFCLEKLPHRTKWAIVNKYRELTGKR